MADGLAIPTRPGRYSHWRVHRGKLSRGAGVDIGWEFRNAAGKLRSRTGDTNVALVGVSISEGIVGHHHQVVQALSEVEVSAKAGVRRLVDVLIVVVEA